MHESTAVRLLSIFHALEGRADDVVHVAGRLMGIARRVAGEGCRSTALMEDAGDPGHFVLFLDFDTEALLEAYLEDDERRAALATVAGLVRQEDVERMVLTRVPATVGNDGRG